jgi:hypothetical protein
MEQLDALQDLFKRFFGLRIRVIKRFRKSPAHGRAVGEFDLVVAVAVALIDVSDNTLRFMPCSRSRNADASAASSSYQESSNSDTTSHY